MKSFVIKIKKFEYKNTYIVSLLYSRVYVHSNEKRSRGITFELLEKRKHPIIRDRKKFQKKKKKGREERIDHEMVKTTDITGGYRVVDIVKTIDEKSRRVMVGAGRREGERRG